MQISDNNYDKDINDAIRLHQNWTAVGHGIFQSERGLVHECPYVVVLVVSEAPTPKACAFDVNGVCAISNHPRIATVPTPSVIATTPSREDSPPKRFKCSS